MVLENNSCLVLQNALGRELLEDLLERGLTHRVLTNVEFTLLLFNHTEEVTNGLIVTWHAELEEITTLLNQLNLGEALRQQKCTCKAVLHRVDVVHEVDDSHGVGSGSGTRLGLEDQV